MRATRKTEDIYRDACRHSHRILGSYLALWAWKKGVDCVVLDRHRLLPFLGLKKAMRERRLHWLDEDVRDLFPYQESLGYSRSGVHMSLYLSRKRFPDGTFARSMTDPKRVQMLSEGGLPASIVGKLPTEDRMTGILATAATGGGRTRRLREKSALGWPPFIVNSPATGPE